MAPQQARETSARAARVNLGSDAGRDVVRTVCGREFTIGDLRLEHLAHPATRVSLSTRPLPQDAETLWASLTPDEARQLAAYLLSHAAAAGATDAADAPPPQSVVEVDYIDPQRYAVRLGDQHPFLVPLDRAAGDDRALDLLTASVAVELARRAERFLARHETRRDGLRVWAQCAHADENRTLRVTVATPPSLTGERKNALRALLTRSVLREPPCCGLRVEITVP